jgi:hypothetical protein
MARPYCNRKTRGHRPGNSEGWQIERSPGKFEGEGLLTIWAWEATMTGDGEIASNGDGGESYTRLDGPFSRAELRGWRNDDGRRLNRSEIRFANHAAGVILHERSDGFVSGRWFAADDAGRAALADAWASIESDLYGDEPDDESDSDGWDCL